MKRETNYKTTQEDMDKWIGIIKVNREKETINFSKN